MEEAAETPPHKKMKKRQKGNMRLG